VEVQKIRARIKKSIAAVTGIDVEAQFDIDAPEEELKEIRTIGDTVRVMQQYMLSRVD
jgi:acyl carrier protein